MSGKGKRHDDKFKEQKIKIYNRGNHTYCSLIEKHGVSTAALRSWVIRYNNSKSFKIDDNLTEEENE
ncbi:MAG: transposase [Miniphocaeibacter sp.]|uniref:transposase n=1 Tax=Miniphocaeibacter sp. TaxID=3100973 RepID=UPI0017C46296|nr:transposase [Gallicola sp.]